MENFGEFLRFVRRERGLTQDDVSQKLNLVTPVISKWENGKSMPDLNALCKLCTVLSLSIEEINKRELLDGSKVLPPEKFDAVKLGKFLKKLRIKNSLSQSDVGEKLFVTGQTVSKWENGGVTTLEILNQLSELYSVSPDDLLSGIETEQTQSVRNDIKTVKKLKWLSMGLSLAMVIVLAVCGIVFANLTSYTAGLEKNLKSTITQLEKSESTKEEYLKTIESNNALIGALKEELESIKGE